VLDERATTADGSIGAALSAADAGAKALAAAAELLDAVLKGPGARADRVLRQPTFAARGEFTAMLEALEASLGDAARAATGTAPRRTIPASLKGQRQVAQLLKAQGLVNAARETAQGNVNPQLLVGVLAQDLAEALGDTGRGTA
jgi:hypothetical protein